MQNYPPAISCQQPRHLHRAYAHDQACDSLELDMQQYPCPGLPQVSANTSRCHCCSVLAVTVSLTYAESDLHARYDFRLNWPDRARHLSLPRYTHPPTMTCSGPKHNYSKQARPLHKRERERESLHLSSHTGLMQVLPGHPLADPIRECQSLCRNNATETRTDITSKDRA